jgi:UDP-N-acetylmuramate dehydrogenase
MARHVSWRAGGAVDRAYLPADLDDLRAFLASVSADELGATPTWGRVKALYR